MINKCLPKALSAFHPLEYLGSRYNTYYPNRFVKVYKITSIRELITSCLHVLKQCSRAITNLSNFTEG